MLYELTHAWIFDHYGRPYARNQNQEPDMEYEVKFFK